MLFTVVITVEIKSKLVFSTQAANLNLLIGQLGMCMKEYGKCQIQIQKYTSIIDSAGDRKYKLILKFFRRSYFCTMKGRRIQTFLGLKLFSITKQSP